MKDKVVCGFTDRWRWTVVYKRDNIRVLLRFPVTLCKKIHRCIFQNVKPPDIIFL